MNQISTGSHRGAFSTFTLFLNVASKLKIYIYIKKDASDAGLVFLLKISMAHLKKCFIIYNLFCHFCFKFTIDYQSKEHVYSSV